MTAGPGRIQKPRAHSRKSAAPKSKAPAVPRAAAVAAFVETSHLAVAMTDREIRFLTLSPEWAANLGRDASELVGQNSYDLIPGSREHYGAVHQRALAGEHVLSDPARVRLPTGGHRWMQWEVSPWLDDDGDVGGLLIISRDVTAQKDAEEELRSTRALLSTVLDNIPAPMVVKDGDTGQFLILNRAGEELLGVSRENHIGKTGYDTFPKALADEFARQDKAVLESGELMVIEEELIPTATHGLRRLRTKKLAVPSADGRKLLLAISEDITERKEAEEELIQTRAFIQTILENVPSPLVVKDETGHVLLMNRAMEQLYGVSRDAHVGKRVQDLISPQDAAQVAEEDRKVLESDAPLIVDEARVFTERQGLRHMRKVKVPIRNPDGSRYLLAISEDITERLHAQQELERTREFLTNVLDSAPLAMVVKDARDGRIIMINRANEALFGLTREELIGKTALDMFPPEQAEQFIAHDRAAVETGEVQIIDEARVQTHANGVRTLRMMKVGIRDPDGVPCVLTISEDVTEQRKTNQELRRAEAFLQTVIENMPAGLTVKDAATGRLLMLNPAVEELYGVKRGENVGKTGRDIFPPDQAERFAREDREMAEAGGVKVLEEEPTWTRNGVRFIRKKKIVIRNDEGPDYLLSISEDVTDRKQAQDDLMEALARAEAANVAKSEFLANMSHEIRTPLNGVLGLADALSHMDLEPRQLEIVRMIVSSGQALTMLLGDVLDLAKAEAGALALNPEGFSVRDTVGQAAFLFERVAREKGLDFTVDFDPDGPDRLVGDPLRIKQVVSNLISNAVKFTAEGEVRIHVGVKRGARGKAVLRVSVKDTGPGFTEETRAKLFGRFEQGDGSITRRYGGTGLGLSIANTLANMMAGEITCSATPGQGAAFEFTARLKVDRQAAPASVSATPSPALEAERPPRVLLAEDHPVNQQVVQLMLGDTAELVITSDGRQALDAFLEGPPFDVVLMDTQMPVMDGLTAIRRIREAEARRGLARTPIISLTANAMGHQIEACLEAGADRHLAKPVTSAGLFGAINAALDGAAGRTAGAAARQSA